MTEQTKAVEVIQADRDAAAAVLGYRDWDDATDYRLTGAQDRQRDDLVQAFAAAIGQRLTYKELIA